MVKSRFFVSLPPHTHTSARAPPLEVTRTATTEPQRHTRRGARSALQAPDTYTQAPAGNRRRCATRIGHPHGTTRTSRASCASRVARGTSFASRHMRGATDARRGREHAWPRGSRARIRGKSTIHTRQFMHNCGGESRQTARAARHAGVRVQLSVHPPAQYPARSPAAPLLSSSRPRLARRRRRRERRSCRQRVSCRVTPAAVSSVAGELNSSSSSSSLSPRTKHST